MGRKKMLVESDGAEQLRELVEQVDENGDFGEKRQSRRGLLKMAGAALAGAAGAAALRAVPAAAATGSAVLQGCSNFPGADNPTEILTSSTHTGDATASAFVGQSSTGVLGVGNFGTTPSLEIGVVGNSKNGPGTGVAGNTVGGVAIAGNDTSGGYGVLGVTSGGYDLAAGTATSGGPAGSGRLAMVGRTDIGGVAPNWNPGFALTTTGAVAAFEHELVRGYDSSIWASRADASSATKARWKRINTVRVDSSDGAGTIFKPFRVLDTRGGAKKAVGSLTVVTVAGQGSGLSHIPSDAVAVMGNLAAVNYSGAGFLAIMPAGITLGTGAGQYNKDADPSSVNFIVGQAAIANSFVCGLNGGQLQVFVGGSASHFVIDVTAYLQ